MTTTRLTQLPGRQSVARKRAAGYAQLIYDSWNRLVEVRDASNVTLVRYGYDAHGWRITEDKGTVRDFFYSADWQVLEERTGGAADVQYVWSPVYVDAMVLRDRDTDNNGSLDERLYVTQDANFNVTALVDTAGGVVERYAYDPYGVQTILDSSWNTISSSTVAFAHGHQGLRFEIVSGLHWNRNRDYSATLMRFTQNDPAGMVDGTNLYVAVKNNPQTLLDPSGLGTATASYACFSVRAYCSGKCTCTCTPRITNIHVGIQMLIASQFCCAESCLTCPRNPGQATNMSACMSLTMTTGMLLTYNRAVFCACVCT